MLGVDIWDRLLAYYNVVQVVWKLIWNIYIRKINIEKINDIHWLLYNDPESGYRARMILLRKRDTPQYLR